MDIKFKNTTLLSTPINEDSKRKFELMNDDYITLNFSLAEPIQFPIGSQIEYGYPFEIIEKQDPTYNTATDGYDYELKFEAYYRKWKNKIFKYTPEVGGREASWSLTATLDVHLEVVIRNLNALGYTYYGKEFTFAIDDTVENEAKLMTYSEENILDALSDMAEEWDCEWWVTDNVIHFGRCEYGSYTDFEIGKNVVSMSSSDSQTEYATRIYAFGSTRNLPKNYRPVDESMTVNGVVEQHLLLPEGTPYIDAYENMTEEQAIEGVKVFEDIFPRSLSTITAIETYIGTETDDDGNKYEQTFYRFRDSSRNFSRDYILEDETLHVVFQSGKLNGMDFEIQFNPKGAAEKLNGVWNIEAQLFEIVVNEDYGRELPDEVLCPEVGDEYILYGYDTKAAEEWGLIDEAEQELLTEAKKYVEKTKIDPKTYSCVMMSDYMYGLDEKGNQDANYAISFEVGDRVKLINSAFFEEGYRKSRIIGFEYYLDYPYDNPTYIVGETASYSRLGEIEDDIEEITLAGQTYSGSSGSSVYLITSRDTTAPSDRNAYSARRAYLEFLSKKRDDRTDFNINIGGTLTSEKNTVFGKRFVSGMTGIGGQIDSQGNGELQSLILRGFLQAPEYRFNRIDVVSGELWNTHAYGTLEEVDTENQIATIKLEDNELGTLHLSDICRGIFYGGDSKEGEDECGFYSMAGFATSYFTPTDIITNEAGKFVFRYALKDGTSVHPSKYMNFASYGNFTDADRQASCYMTRTYTRYLSGVNTWVINPDKNITAQFGLLDGLQIGSMEMSGYGSFQSNAYFKGTVIQFTAQQLAELKGESAYSVHLSDDEVIVKTDSDGNVILLEDVNVTAGGENVTANGENVIVKENIIKTSVQAFKGNEELFFSPIYAEGAFMTSIKCVACEASVINGAIYVTSVTDLPAYVDITISCEGNATFNKRFTITGVQDGEQGISPTVYELTPSNMPLNQSMTGKITPQSFVVTCYGITGNERVNITPTSWKVEASTDGATWVTYPSSNYTTKNSQLTMTNLSVSYGFYRISAVVAGQTIYSYASKTTDGSNGSMPRYRGTWQEQSDNPYVYNDEYCDIVVYNSNAYMVKSYGSSLTTEVPSSDSDYWKLANYFDFVAMDTALIDGANIANFLFKNGIMCSQDTTTDESGKEVPLLTLNGKTGEITARKGTFSGDVNITYGSTNVKISASDASGMSILHDGITKTSFTSSDKEKDDLFGSDADITDVSFAKAYDYVSLGQGDLDTSTWGNVDSKTWFGKNTNLYSGYSVQTITVSKRSLVTFDTTSGNLFSATLKWNGSENVNTMAWANLYLDIRLVRQSDKAEFVVSNDASLDIEFGEQTGNYSAGIAKKSMMLDAGVYTVQANSYIEVWVSADTNLGSIYARLDVAAMTVSIDQIAWHSDFFGNGFAVGTSSEHNFQAVNEDGVMDTQMVSGNGGFRAYEDYARVKIGGKWYKITGVVDNKLAVQAE